MAFNLSDPDLLFDSELEVWARVEHPENIDVFFEVLTRSKKHPEHKKKLNALARKLSKDRDIAQRKKQQVDPLKYEEELMAMTSSLIIDWKGIQEAKKDVEFKSDKMVELMKSQPWIFEQVDAFQADDNNFFKKGD